MGREFPGMILQGEICIGEFAITLIRKLSYFLFDYSILYVEMFRENYHEPLSTWGKDGKFGILRIVYI